MPPLCKGATQHAYCLVLQINVNFWCKGLRSWWFFYVRYWETWGYHTFGAVSHRGSPPVLPAAPQTQTKLFSKRRKSRDRVRSSYKETRCMLRAEVHPPRQVLSRGPTASLQGTSWKKSLHLSQFGPSVLCWQMHRPWTCMCEEDKWCEHRAYLRALRTLGFFKWKMTYQATGSLWVLVSHLLVTIPALTIFYYLLN